MKTKQVIIVSVVFLVTIALAITCGKTYAKYVLTKHYDTTFSSYPFYFEVKDVTDNRIYARSDQVVNLNIKNYVDNQYNEFDTKYTITLEDNDIFTLKQGQVEGTIEASKKDKTVALALNLKPNFKTGGSITFVIKTTEPYTKEVKIKVSVNKLGDYVKEIADSKTCHYNGQDFSISQTDSPCNGADGFYDTPPYYTYFWGTNDCLNFNYVWYSGYMWRITEILNDGKVKMISENILSAINFGQSAYFNESYIKQWLNEDFLDTLYNHENILVEDATWDISPWYNWCWVNPPKKDTATVGLMNPYEFNKTAGYSSYNFLNLGHSWWLSSYSDPWSDISITVSGIQQDGTITGWDVPNTAFGVRPVVVLKEDVKFSGTGTQDDPFVLLDDIQVAKEGDPINTRTPGELVKINDMLYRIVNTHENEDGKLVTKLKSANYIKDDNGSVMTKQFGSMDFKYDANIGVSETYYKIANSNNNNYYWLSYLNNEWLEKQGIKKYLVEDTYYVKPVQNDYTSGSRIGSYKNAICEGQDTKETTKICKKTNQIWKGYVGLPIVGELFAYPLGGTDTHDYKTATMTPYGDGNYPMIGAFEPETQGIFQETYNNDFAVKPTITLKEDVIIKSGDGKTPQTAYEIKLPNEES